MKHLGTWLTTAVVLFGVGAIVAPACRALGVPSETSEYLVAANWISGGLACVVLGKMNGEW
jgi:hypothetical protein